MGCAPQAVTVGKQVLGGKFSSPLFSPLRWVVSYPVLQHVMIQVGCAGVGMQLCCPSSEAAAYYWLYGECWWLFLRSELFPIPHSPQMARTAPWAVLRFAGTILFTVPIKQTGMWQPSHSGCSKTFLCCRSRPDWRLVLPVNRTAHPALPMFRRVCAVCIHALDPNSFSRAGNDVVCGYRENPTNFSWCHNRTTSLELQQTYMRRYTWVFERTRKQNLFFLRKLLAASHHLSL